MSDERRKPFLGPMRPQTSAANSIVRFTRAFPSPTLAVRATIQPDPETPGARDGGRLRLG